MVDSTECRSHGFKYPLITRKSNPALLSDEFVTNPNSKLTRFSASGFDFYTKFPFEQRRHTGSTRWIGTSGQAMTDHDLFHKSTIDPACPFMNPERRDVVWRETSPFPAYNDTKDCGAQCDFAGDFDGNVRARNAYSARAIQSCGSASLTKPSAAHQDHTDQHQHWIPRSRNLVPAQQDPRLLQQDAVPRYIQSTQNRTKSQTGCPDGHECRKFFAGVSLRHRPAGFPRHQHGNRDG